FSDYGRYLAASCNNGTMRIFARPEPHSQFLPLYTSNKHVTSRLLSLLFLTLNNSTDKNPLHVLLAGNKSGQVLFWEVNGSKVKEDLIDPLQAHNSINIKDDDGKDR